MLVTGYAYAKIKQYTTGWIHLGSTRVALTSRTMQNVQKLSTTVDRPSTDGLC